MGKDSIIDRIRSANLDKVDLSGSALYEEIPGDFAENFTKALEANHVNVVSSENWESTLAILKELIGSGKNYASDISEIASSTDAMHNLSMYITQSSLGVAENGAMWISSANEHRVLPFIVDHLIVVIAKNNLVNNMHKAYQSVSPEGFGVFIAGPSKTADIEQSLVIGAHGAKEMTVILQVD